jgi:ferredoxin
LPQTKRLMLKDEDLCVHCGLCAERCPTAAWDMQKFELSLTYAGGQKCPSGRGASGGAPEQGAAKQAARSIRAR